jgi:hypothetical protein
MSTNLFSRFQPGDQVRYTGQEFRDELRDKKVSYGFVVIRVPNTNSYVVDLGGHSYLLHDSLLDNFRHTESVKASTEVFYNKRKWEINEDD